MTEPDFTNEQLCLFGKIESELRRESALAYIAGEYKNKTQAYLSACEKLDKKPSKNPDVSAAEILNYPSVVDFINSVKANAANAAQVDAYYVLRRLKQIDELDVIDIVSDDMSEFKPLKEWPKEWRTSISGIDIQSIVSGGDEPIEKVIKKIKWPDKVKNLEMIGKHVNVGAWEKEQSTTNVVHNIMPVPVADSAEDWEKAAQAQQEKALSHE